MSAVVKFLIGLTSDSASGTLSVADILSAARDAAFVAGIVFLETFDKADFGPFETLTAAVIGFAVSALRRFVKDYTSQ